MTSIVDARYLCVLVCSIYCFWTGVQMTSVKLAVIVPEDTGRLFSSHHIAPVLHVAIDHVIQHSLLSNVNISVHFGDSKCNSKDAPIKAFDFYRKDEVDVFLGPICDYSLAPVARYAPYWNIPVLSPGGFAHDFGVNKNTPDAEYSSLTRVGVTFNSLALSLIHIAKNHYNWTRIKVIYEGEGQSNVTPRFCFLAASALVYYSKEYRLSYDFHIYIPKIHNPEDLLLNEVGVDYNSEYGDVLTYIESIAMDLRFV